MPVVEGATAEFCFVFSFSFSYEHIIAVINGWSICSCVTNNMFGFEQVGSISITIFYKYRNVLKMLDVSLPFHI